MWNVYTAGCKADAWRGWWPGGKVTGRSPLPAWTALCRRHKIPKASDRVTNWPAYEAALVRRGWLTEEAIAAWYASATGEQGGQPVYSDLAIATGLALRLVPRQPLRRTEGALRSIADRLGAPIRIPERTTFRRRGGSYSIRSRLLWSR